ncbi:MAG: N-acetylmuramoyl-L-alanine amidase [Actinomycetota bacterium]
MTHRFRSSWLLGRPRGLAVGGALVMGLTLLSWLPPPIRAGTAPESAPVTVARRVPIRLAALLSKARSDSFRVLEDGVRLRRSVRLAPAVLCAPIQFTAFGLVWDQRGAGTVSGSVRVAPGLRELGRIAREGRATSLEDADGPDVGSPDHRPDIRATEMVWVGAARCARVALKLPPKAAISRMRAVFVNTSGTALGDRPAPTSEGGSALPGFWGPAPAEAMTSQPGIISRARWGADESLRNCDPFYAREAKMAFVHHTANSNNYSKSQSDDLIRAIYWYHTQTLGWCDIAYNFLIDRFGRVFEGRFGGIDRPVIPGATRGFNTGSVAVAALGDHRVTPPSSATIVAFERLLAWRLDVAHVSPIGGAWMQSRGNDRYREGKWVWFHAISGHRDAGSTSCPGERLYRWLGSIRDVSYGMGLPKIFQPRQSGSPLIPRHGSVTWRANASQRLKWRLQVLDQSGSPVWSHRARGTRFLLRWDGLSGMDDYLQPGVYTVKLWGTSRLGTARAALFNLVVLR